jgi:hypothetical protein
VCFTIPNVPLLQFAAVHQDDLKDEISFHAGLWAINGVVLC